MHIVQDTPQKMQTPYRQRQPQIVLKQEEPELNVYPDFCVERQSLSPTKRKSLKPCPSNANLSLKKKRQNVETYDEYRLALNMVPELENQQHSVLPRNLAVLQP